MGVCFKFFSSFTEMQLTYNIVYIEGVQCAHLCTYILQNDCHRRMGVCFQIVDASHHPESILVQVRDRLSGLVPVTSCPDSSDVQSTSQTTFEPL